MAVVNIFLTDPTGDTLDNFVHGDSTFTFNSIDGGGPRRLVEGPMWVFVDWAMPELSGLEMCRRLANRRHSSPPRAAAVSASASAWTTASRSPSRT